MTESIGHGDASMPAHPRLGMGFQVWGQFVSWERLMETGRLIDELGFESLWSNDHLLPVRGGGEAPVELMHGPVFDGWMTLMGWSSRTRRVTLGCMVSSVAYRSPALLVKMATALDHDSGGRAILGIGAGWHEAEHAAFGFAYPSRRERLDRSEARSSSACGPTAPPVQRMWSSIGRRRPMGRPSRRSPARCVRPSSQADVRKRREPPRGARRGC